MKVPMLWLCDYFELDEQGWVTALQQASVDWHLPLTEDPARMLAQLFTFAGFNCDEILGNGFDAVLELDVLANRPDGQSMLGLARELAAMLQVALKPLPLDLTESAAPVEQFASVEVRAPETCLRYTARVIRNVKVGPSPQWLQDRLRAMGQTPRNNVVDVTNFVLFELGHPLHAFDLNKLAGRKIVVRRAEEREPFKPLYDEVPPLTGETLVIADAEKPVAIGGVIGGAESSVSAETVDLLLEAATFAPVQIRRTCRRLKIGTDSSYRFERGVDAMGLEIASARAARLICEVAGGTLCRGILDSRPEPQNDRVVRLRLDRLDALFGAPIPEGIPERTLVSLGCAVTTSDNRTLNVKVPYWRRSDLQREVDLIEEVVRLYGYHRISTKTSLKARIAPRSPMEVTADATRSFLTAQGYFETVTDSLIDPQWPQINLWTASPVLTLDRRSVMREDHSALRNTLLPSLLEVVTHNIAHRAGPSRIFELGKAFLPSSEREQPEECPVLGILDETPSGFAQIADALRKLSSGLSCELAHLKLTPVTTQQTFPHCFEQGSVLRIVRVRETTDHERAEDQIGWHGKIASTLAQKFCLKKAPAYAELNLQALAQLPKAPATYRPLPRQPEVIRDVALVVDEYVTWQEIEDHALLQRDPLRDASARPRFLSVFKGKQIPSGKKSVAFSLSYRVAERTLSDEEVNRAHQRFVEGLLKKFDATLRQ